MFTNRLNILSYKQYNVKKGDHILTEKELLSFLKNIEKAEKEARKKRNIVIRWKRIKVKVQF